LHRIDEYTGDAEVLLILPLFGFLDTLDLHSGKIQQGFDLFSDYQWQIQSLERFPQDISGN
jgi:hypothetical protein